MSTTFGMFTTSPTVLQPQALPMGMYTTQAPPMGMYTTQSPPVGMYAMPGKDMPPQGPPIGTHMLITTQSLIYGDVPIQCICPHCHQGIATRVEKKTGILPWLICGGILLFGGWLGCCLIPFCIDDLKVS
jgi:lipopolysaccharide-induced tumor necrosis factor-alpha factor